MGKSHDANSYYSLRKAFAAYDAPEGLTVERRRAMAFAPKRGHPFGKQGRRRSPCNLFLNTNED